MTATAQQFVVPGTLMGAEVREERPFLWLPADLIERVLDTPGNRGQRVMWLAILTTLADEVSGQWSRRPAGERSCTLTHGLIGDMLRLGSGAGSGRHTVMRHTRAMADAGILLHNQPPRTPGSSHQPPPVWTIPSADGSVFGWTQRRAHGRVVKIWRSSFTKLTNCVDPKLVTKAVAVYVTLCWMVETQDGKSSRCHVTVDDLCERAGIGADHKTRAAVMRELTKVVGRDLDGSDIHLLVTPIKSACDPARAQPRCFEPFDFTA